MPRRAIDGQAAGDVIDGQERGSGGGCVATDPTHEGTTTDVSSNGADIVLTHPAGLVAGELMLVALVTGESGSSVWINLIQVPVEAGWTLLAGERDFANLFSAFLFAKIATAADVAAGSTTFPIGGFVADASAAAMHRISGNDISELPNVGTAGKTQDATTPYTSGTVSTGTAGGLAYYFCAVDDNVVITVPGTLISDFSVNQTDTNPVGLAGGHKSVASGGATGTEDFTTPANENGILFVAMVRGLQAA